MLGGFIKWNLPPKRPDFVQGTQHGLEAEQLLVAHHLPHNTCLQACTAQCPVGFESLLERVEQMISDWMRGNE